MSNGRASTRAKWELVYRDFEGSGLAVGKFCAARGIKYCTFKVWHRAFRGESKGAVQGAEAGAFREVVSGDREWSYTIGLRSGRTLGIAGGFEESRLRVLIEVLESC